MTEHEYRMILVDKMKEWLDVEEIIKRVAAEEADEYVGRNERSLSEVIEEKVRRRLHGIFDDLSEEAIEDLVEDEI